MNIRTPVTKNPRLIARHTISRALHAYADFRIGATKAEKRCHKTSDTILLTFDDFGSPEQVQSILAILSQKQTKAMFFLIGEWANEHPELVALIQRGGHIIGNHTYSHATLLGLSDEAVRDEIEKGKFPTWLRPPQGRYNKRIRRLASSLGYSICYWTIDSRDWTGASVEEMRHTILSELHPGATILFHLQGAHTIELLPSLIDEIRQAGYSMTGPAETWQPAAHL